jgi:MFS family permease
MARRLPGGAAFWMLGTIFGFLLFAASAPSPLYPVYQAVWHFSAVTLTVVFAVYAFALLATLLVAGSISDHVGRRPALVGSLLAEALAMAVFAGARGVGWLIAARIVQGLATGVATGTLSAALIDLQPADRPGWGPLTSSTAPSAGLAAGALGAGLAVQYGPAPRHLIFWLLTAVFVLGAAGAAAMPETVPFDRGWLASLRPRAAVPLAARAAFLATTPILVATWALGGLYLSLGSSLTILLLHTRDRLVGGLPIVALAGAGGLLAVLTRTWPGRRAMLVGAVLLACGVGLTLAAVVAGQGWLFLAGSAVAGTGFGPAFAGTLRVLSPLASAAQRAGLLAAVYVVSYLAFSLPALAAGFAVTRIGLRRTAEIYSGVLIVLAVLAVLAFALRRRERAAATEPGCAPCPGTVAAFARSSG